MFGHPAQIGITGLFIMAICGVAGRLFTENNAAAAWLFFGALFLFAFFVVTPVYFTHQRCQSHRRY